MRCSPPGMICLDTELNYELYFIQFVVKEKSSIYGSISMFQPNYKIFSNKYN
jgi:hypothetical protein